MKSKAVQRQYVGLGVHKESVQVAVMDKKGRVLNNARVSNNDGKTRETLARIPESAKCVTELSSVWYGLFRLVSDSLKRDVILSNPFETKAIATSRKKTYRVDVQILADLLGGAGTLTGVYSPRDTPGAGNLRF